MGSVDHESCREGRVAKDEPHVTDMVVDATEPEILSAPVLGSNPVVLRARVCASAPARAPALSSTVLGSASVSVPAAGSAFAPSSFCPVSVSASPASSPVCKFESVVGRELSGREEEELLKDFDSMCKTEAGKGTKKWSKNGKKCADGFLAPDQAFHDILDAGGDNPSAKNDKWA
jgi:hypothetical protein